MLQHCLDSTTHHGRSLLVAETEPPLKRLGDLGDGGDAVLRERRLGATVVIRVGAASTLVGPDVHPLLLPGPDVTRARGHRGRVEPV